MRQLSPLLLSPVSEEGQPEHLSPGEGHSEQRVQDHEETTTREVISDNVKSIADSVHITDAWHAGKHNDEESMIIIGSTRALETDALSLAYATGDSQKVLDLIHGWHRMVLEKLHDAKKKKSHDF